MIDDLARPDVARPPETGSLRRGVALNVASLGIQGALRLGFTVSAARVLGPAGYADFGVALAVSVLVAIVWPASAGSAVVKYVRIAWGGDRPADASAVLRHLLGRLVRFLAVVTPLLWAGSLLVSSGAALAWGLLLMSWGYSLQTFGRGVHLATGQLLREFVLQATCGVLALSALAIIELRDDVGPGVVALVYGGAMSLCGLLTWPRSAPSGGAAPPGVDRFVWLAAVGSLASAGFVQLLVVAGKLRFDDHEAGVLSAAANLASTLTLASAATSMALYPRVSQLVGRADDDGVRRLRRSVFRQLVRYLFWALAAFLVLAPTLVPVVLGEAYREAVEPLSVMALAAVTTTVAAPSVAVMTSGPNRSVARMSGAAWLGMAVGVAVWGLAWLGDLGGIGGVASGFALGTAVTATAAIAWADRVTADRLLPTWLLVLAALASLTSAQALAGRVGWGAPAYVLLAVSMGAWAISRRC